MMVMITITIGIERIGFDEFKMATAAAAAAAAAAADIYFNKTWDVDE